jgi:hypothetical protein
MGLREYLFQKVILTPSNVGYLSQIVTNSMADSMKDSIMQTLSDEEIAAAVAAYSDAIVDRELKRFWGSVGGTQKGLNFQMQEANPLSNILDKEGNLSLSGIINMLARGWMQNKSVMGQIPQNTPQTRRNTNIVPEMKSI